MNRRTRKAASPARRWRRVCVAFTALAYGLSGSSMAADITASSGIIEVAQASEEEAAEAYLARLRQTLEMHIVPRLKHGIVDIATSRPSTLTVRVTNSASPYSVGANIEHDGSLIVQLSIGYATMHDAALDAVELAAVLGRPRDLHRYLLYQLQLAHENHMRRGRGLRAQRAMSFAAFIGLDPKITQRIFAQPDWRKSREHVQAESLGWVLSYLLVRADPTLAGLSPGTARDGEGAARLAATSGWFPVPPVATALGIAAIERPRAASFDERVVLCRAGRLMEAGVAILERDAQPTAALRGQLAEIRARIANMQRDGGCAPQGIVTAQPNGRNAISSGMRAPV